ncbi:SseB family protein [Mycolicibacterium sp. XJ2]
MGEFAAQPNQRTSLDVLRSCMYGELLFDITGSDEPQDGSFGAGSELQFRGGTGPDGGRALYVFTRQEEISRLYPPDTRTQSMVTPATGALSFARSRQDAWLYIDPAGPTCALSAADIDFALRNPNNEPLKTALAALDAGDADRQDVLQVLLTEGPLLLGADGNSVPGKTLIRSMTLRDGSTALVGFTSAPEVAAHNPFDGVGDFTTLRVLDMVRKNGHGGIVVNPAGPSIAFSAAEIDG